MIVCSPCCHYPTPLCKVWVTLLAWKVATWRCFRVARGWVKRQNFPYYHVRPGLGPIIRLISTVSVLSHYPVSLSMLYIQVSLWYVKTIGMHMMYWQLSSNTHLSMLRLLLALPALALADWLCAPCRKRTRMLTCT